MAVENSLAASNKQKKKKTKKKQKKKQKKPPEIHATNRIPNKINK